MKLDGKLAQLFLNRFEVGAEFIGSVARTEPTLAVRSMPFRCYGAQIDIKHLRRPVRKLAASRMTFHCGTSVCKYLPKAFQCSCFHAILIGERLRRDSRAKLGEKFMRSSLIRRRV